MSTRSPPRKWWKQRRPSDRVMENGRDTDFVIVIMGPTGVGKSTFMNHVAGAEVTRVGHDLVSCTQDIQWYIIEGDTQFKLAGGQRLVLVDTPGFNDTYVDDSEILRRIAVWLASSYDNKMKLGGVVYLYDISAKRLTGATNLNLKMFEKLCGSRAFDRVIIGTTKWSSKNDEQSQHRLTELQRTYWAPLVAQGAKIRRIDNKKQSCVDAVNSILATPVNATKINNIQRALRIQQELVDEEKLVPRTEAGRTLNFSMKDMLKAKKQELGDTRNTDSRKQLQEEIDWLKGQIDELHTGFFQRLKWRFLS